MLIEGLYNNTSGNFSEVTPMLSLTRSLGGGDVLENGMVYFQYAEGFVSGSFNDSFGCQVTSPQIFLEGLSNQPLYLRSGR